ncbi:MAG TPA: type II secretion system protein G [Thermoanaerobaculia bacterium]|nr:type II secretion system protein G [Thermoanaerobaculia bacterium]
MRLRALLFIPLLALACHREADRAAREEALKQNLGQLRQAIAKYRADTGQYPPSLEALVPRYLAKIPADPITEKPDWRLTTEESVQPSSDFSTGTAAASTSVVVDVHSAAPGYSTY